MAPRSFYAEAVQWMADEGITHGVTPQCFAPERVVTRGEAAAFIWRMQGEPAPAAPHRFSDAREGWLHEAVGWMAEAQITRGTTATTFEPGRVVTRGELAAFLWRLEGEPPSDSAHPFTDVDQPWQDEPISWMAGTEVTAGLTPTTFGPERPVTRGQLAAFLHRYKASPAVAVDPASPPCGATNAPVVVTVMGDSTGTRVAAGLRAHGEAAGTISVIDWSDPACSALIDAAVDWRVYRISYGYLGEFRAPFDQPCRHRIDPDDVGPDLVLMVDHGSVTADHRRADGTWASVLDADLLSDLRTIYGDRIEEATAIGAKVVFTTAPLMRDDTGLLEDMADPARLAAYNGFLRELAAAEPAVRLIEVGPVFEQPGADQRYRRTDGLHLDPDGAEHLAADLLAPALLEIAGR